MIVNPILPIWAMALICIVLLFLITRNNKKRALRQVLIIILLFIINLRIQLKSGTSQIVTTNIDVLFVIDNTLSMVAEDYDGYERRLDGVKEDCDYILEELSGANFSLITFNNTAQLVFPYTKDVSMVESAVKTLKTMDNLNGRGTTLNVSYDMIEEQLKKSKEKDETRKRILFLISDGEITAENSKLESFSGLNDLVDGGAVLGYGTEKGGKMKYDSTTNSSYYVQDNTGEFIGDAISKIDEDNLNKIASDIGIEYVHMEDKSDIDDILYNIKKEASSSVDKADSNNIDIYYVFSIPLIILLIFEFLWYKKNL